MTCETIHALGSWPILLVIIPISLGLGAFWHSKHVADVKRRHRPLTRDYFPAREWPR